MATREIRFIPDLVLEQKSKKVTSFDDDLKKLVKDMLDTMRAKFGIGLSAVQIGELQRVVVMEYQPEDPDEEGVPLTVLINPKITNRSQETDVADEGCLSLPGVELPVRRAKKITVLAQDIEGKRFKLRASDLYARVIQHEIDHLNGELFIDKAEVEFPFARKKIKTVFFGTPEFALPTLHELHHNPLYDLRAVVTESDKPAGRGKLVAVSQVKKYALENNIPILQPDHLKESKYGLGKEDAEKFKAKIKALDPDICIVVAYGKIIPVDILNIPKFGFINIHASLLPKYRGASPMQAAILAGDKVTGITIIKMDEGLDTGPILGQTEIEIPLSIDYVSLSREMARFGAELAILTIPRYISGIIQPREQEGRATSTHLIKKEDGLVNVQEDDPTLIERKIRAYTPWPGVFIKSSGKLIKIVTAHIENGKLVIDHVKPEGKNEMSYADYLRGNPALTK